MVIPPDEVTDAVLYRMAGARKPSASSARTRSDRCITYACAGSTSSARIVRGSISITGALGERRNASLRVRRAGGRHAAP